MNGHATQALAQDFAIEKGVTRKTHINHTHLNYHTHNYVIVTYVD